MDLLVKRHGECHAKELYDQHAHGDGPEKVFVVVQPLFYLLVTTPCPEDVGGVASAAMVELLAAAVRHHVIMQGQVPVIVVHHATTSPLSLYGVPRVPQAGIVIRVVQHQPFFQVASGVFIHLVSVDKEQDEEDEFGQEDDQENDEEAQQQALVLLDGAQATQKARHHDDGAEADDEVGGGERRERGRQRGEAALRDRQPHADAEQSAPAEPEEQVEEEEHVFNAADATTGHD